MMNNSLYSCIKNFYDSVLTCPDNTKIFYQDMSEWMDDEGYFIADSYEVLITPPGRIEAIPVTVSTRGLTTITNKDLNINAVNINDGIYRLEVFSCGLSYIRYKALTPSLRCSLSKYISTLNPSDDFTKAKDLKMYIEASEVNSALGKPNMAREYFMLAEREIGKLNSNCKC